MEKTKEIENEEVKQIEDIAPEENEELEENEDIMSYLVNLENRIQALESSLYRLKNSL